MYAVLIDAVSIQRYIFGSNKLKLNVGASFLVHDVYCIAHAKAKAVVSTLPQQNSLTRSIDILGNEYTVTIKIGNLSYRNDEDSHISIVHIPVNGMGRDSER